MHHPQHMATMPERLSSRPAPGTRAFGKRSRLENEAHRSSGTCSRYASSSQPAAPRPGTCGTVRGGRSKDDHRDREPGGGGVRLGGETWKCNEGANEGLAAIAQQRSALSPSRAQPLGGSSWGGGQGRPHRRARVCWRGLRRRRADSVWFFFALPNSSRYERIQYIGNEHSPRASGRQGVNR